MSVINIEDLPIESWKRRAADLDLDIIGGVEDNIMKIKESSRLLWEIIKSLEKSHQADLCPHCEKSKENKLLKPDEYGSFVLEGDKLYCYLPYDGWVGIKVNYCPWCGRNIVAIEKNRSEVMKS